MAFDQQDIIRTPAHALPPQGLDLADLKATSSNPPGEPMRSPALMITLGSAILLMTVVSRHVSDYVAPQPAVAPLTAPAAAVIEPAPLTPVAVETALSAIQKMDLPTDAKSRLTHDVEAGIITVKALSLRAVSAGLSVRLESAGLSQTVTLSTQPTSVLVPVPANGLLRMTGIDRNTGVIRYGRAGHEVALPTLAAGQAIMLPVQEMN